MTEKMSKTQEQITDQITEQIKSGKLLATQTKDGWLLTKHPPEDAPAVASTYKDRIFRMVFDDRKELLMLYNAMNGTHYDNPEDLSVTTLENAIYLCGSGTEIPESGIHLKGGDCKGH